MAIIVQCNCGKKFKAKDSLSGKRVRCPGCQKPVTVGGEDGPRKGKSGPDSSGFDPQEALARYEAAQKKKAETAAEEAARQEEKNRLIASYDQLSGKKKKKDQKKDELAADTKPKKPTVVVKAADAGGSILSNPLVKYLIIAALLGGGAYGSVKLVTFIVNYTSGEVTSGPKPDELIADLEMKTRKAAASGDLAQAEAHLAEILRVLPEYKTKRPRDYEDLMSRIERLKKRE
ncbi:MAG TPA: hypothetical protein P5081_14905 [Phycisphaerae bacterium]|nr:hypothetical protein [Phycisphaerae bacterium]HRW54159.1 hypothetical protein [Phycisphaerae bacterium]